MDRQTIGAVLSAAAIVGAFLVWVWRKAVPAIRKWSRFADRVMGVPEDRRTGQAEIPGIFERLDHQDDVLETIRHEVEFNNGTSVKDAVSRVERKLDEHLTTQPPTTTINVSPGSAP